MGMLNRRLFNINVKRSNRKEYIDMRVIAVDPAPKKGGTVFDGVKYQNFRPIRLASYLEGLAEEASVLVCWDAPLTGPRP